MFEKGTTAQRRNASAIRRAVAYAAVFALALCVAPMMTVAQELDAWRRTKVSFSASSADLPSLLRDVAAAAGLRAKVENTVIGKAKYQAKNTPLEQVLSDLGARYSFEWWYDGSKILVSPASDNLARILRFERVTPMGLERTLKSLGIFEPRFKFRVGEGDLAYLTGPPSYIAAVELVLQDLETAAARREKTGDVEETVVIKSIKWGRVGTQTIDAAEKKK